MPKLKLIKRVPRGHLRLWLNAKAIPTSEQAALQNNVHIVLRAVSSSGALAKINIKLFSFYLCRNEECARTFTAQDVKGKHFPLNVVIEAMSYYNLGFSLEETCRIINKKFSIDPLPETLSAWLNEYKELCRYERLRPYAVKMCSPKDTIEVVSMAHRQLYRFRYHRPKTALMLTEFGNRHLPPLARIFGRGFLRDSAPVFSRGRADERSAEQIFHRRYGRPKQKSIMPTAWPISSCRRFPKTKPGTKRCRDFSSPTIPARWQRKCRFI